MEAATCLVLVVIRWVILVQIISDDELVTSVQVAFIMTNHISSGCLYVRIVEKWCS